MERWIKEIRSIAVVIFITTFAFGSQQVLENLNTELVAEDDPLLIFSTLGGSLVAVSRSSGEIRWQHDDEPVVRMPINLSETQMPMFLPDPRDGSLYLYGRDSEALKKLPFTIPQLVASSPCKSTDGILYTGRKVDTWFNIDPTTGEKEQFLTFNQAKNSCPLKAQNAIYIGRTEYNIIMADIKHKNRKWNVTFYDYSAAPMNPNDDNYDMVHFTASSTGRVVTLDRRTGKSLWELDIESPVIAMYTVTKEGLLTVPFSSIADSVVEKFATNVVTNPTDVQLFPTLYVGLYQHGLYALPSYVDTGITISRNFEHLLLEGPLSASRFCDDDDDDDDDGGGGQISGDHIFISNIDIADKSYQTIKHAKYDIITLGHYNVPAEYKSQNQPLQITGRSDPIILGTSSLNVTNTKISVAIQTSNGTLQPENVTQSTIYSTSKLWLDQQMNTYGMWLKMILFLGFVVAIDWFLLSFHSKEQSQQLSQASRENSGTNGTDMSGNSVILPEDIGEGLVKVGKIIFDTKQILGKGCEGTFVYKGEFDGRAVAVKRLLPDCFMFADREVALLRESDTHANVVRYFCTEQDRMFRYIALELAEATLQDYVERQYDRGNISVKNILLQATSGLAHLHFLDIVHRDIKPHNVLLSVPGPRGEVRAMISDFGLCKKLQLGRVSFSRRSGVTGTDGWIAPEMLNGERTTCAVDIFSLGCVFYYVLSDGKHPFGDPLRRQANILCSKSNLTELQEVSSNDEELALLLIKAMISSDPTERPPASAICTYPIFWSSSEILGFFQDISDRVEKDEADSPALIALETCGGRVIQYDWRLHVDEEVASDLRKYRSYRGESVRDLLRALRNKKHHYRELSPRAQENLGEIPDKFAEYWLSRFPYLLRHVWCAMQSFRNESTLRQYYHPQYTFSNDSEGEDPPRLDRIDQIGRNNNALLSMPTTKTNYRTKFRGQKKKQVKKKRVEIATWMVEPSNDNST